MEGLGNLRYRARRFFCTFPFLQRLQRHVEDNNQGNIRSDKKATKERKIEEQNTEWRIALIYNGTNYVSYICTYYFLLRFWFRVLSS